MRVRRDGRVGKEMGVGEGEEGEGSEKGDGRW